MFHDLTFDITAAMKRCGTLENRDYQWYVHIICLVKCKVMFFCLWNPAPFHTFSGSVLCTLSIRYGKTFHFWRTGLDIETFIRLPDSHLLLMNYALLQNGLQVSPEISGCDFFSFHLRGIFLRDTHQSKVHFLIFLDEKKKPVTEREVLGFVNDCLSRHHLNTYVHACHRAAKCFASAAQFNNLVSSLRSIPDRIVAHGFQDFKWRGWWDSINVMLPHWIAWDCRNSLGILKWLCRLGGSPWLSVQLWISLNLQANNMGRK